MNVPHENTRKQELRVFLSYAATDAVCAHKLRRLLSQRPNLRIFTTEMLSAGEDWETKLREELSRCDVFVVLLSLKSVASEWILHELGAAWALNKPIIPIAINSEVFSKIPITLHGVQFVEIEDIEKPEVINQILDSYAEMITSNTIG